MNFKQFFPYLYFVGAIFILISAISRYSQDVEKYRIIFSFHTEDKNVYLTVRVVIAILIVIAGIAALKRAKTS
jgi:hypothetical protein